ncbi:hypothetical protein LCGC14_3096350, partial [marine sediment metagenome]
MADNRTKFTARQVTALKKSGALSFVAEMFGVEAGTLVELMREQYAEVGITVEAVEHGDREAYAYMVRDKEINDLCC